jgi:hypothetical protein
MTWNPDVAQTYWKKPHGAPGGPGQKMSLASAEAMMRDCLACGAQSGQRCIRVHDGGYTYQNSGQRLGRAHFETRPGQSHRVRFSRACREEAHGRPAHWTDDLNDCITCNPPPVPGTYYEDAPPASRARNNLGVADGH